MVGHDVHREPEQVRQRITLTGQSASVDDALTGTENLVMLGRLSGLSPRAARRGRRTRSDGSRSRTRRRAASRRDRDPDPQPRSTAVVFGVTLLLGFRHCGPRAMAGAAIVINVYILVTTYLYAAIGLAAGSPEAAAGYGLILMFVPYLSSSFVPVETMPSWLQWFAENQPVTPIIETIRGLLMGTPLGTQPSWALRWCAAILIASVVWGAWLFRRAQR